MITRCDHCGSKFEVSNEVVYSSDPQVRCGECMSLFNARTNLFNEAEHSGESARLKPVQKKIPVADQELDTAESLSLETADTVSVEHFYTSAAGKHQSAGDSFSDNNSVSAAAHSSVPSHDELPAYRVDRSYPEEFEFERTLATETALPDNTVGKDSIYRSSTGQTSPDLPAAVADHEDIADTNRQMLRERERRALQMEPERDSNSLSRPDIELDQASPARDEVARQPQSKRSRVDARDITEDMNVVNRSDSNFIPEDVLKRPDVIRDNGRRDDDAMRFKPATPKFDRTYNRNPQRSAVGAAQATTDSTHSQQQNISSKSTRDSGVPRSRVAARNQRIGDHHRRPSREYPAREREEQAFSSRRDRRSTDAETHINPQRKVRGKRRLSSETSAQEMRRFQQSRPSSHVQSVEDELIAEVDSQTVMSPRSKAGAVFWVAGLVIAIGLLLFSARGFIANMNLPEPVISAFCQVTGCVPAQAKKDVSQLQIMRERLYPHPEIENALAISIDVVNNSIYRQPLPTLAVSLLNANNETVGERDFDNTDYEIVDGSESGFLMPAEPTRLIIELVDTGLSATGSVITFK